MDIGQLEGGFVTGLGYLLTEQLKVDSKGIQLNVGTYHIPGVRHPLGLELLALERFPEPARNPRLQALR